MHRKDATSLIGLHVFLFARDGLSQQESAIMQRNMTTATRTTATSNESGPSRPVIIDQIVVAVTGNWWNDLPEKETLCDRSPGKISSFLRANSVAQFSGALFWNEDAADSSSTEHSSARTLAARNRPHETGDREKKPQNPQFLGDHVW